jgi:hypothetical protein
MKDKIDELAMNSKNKNIRDPYRGINEFKKGYKPRSNFVKDEKGDLLADSQQHCGMFAPFRSSMKNPVRLIEKKPELHTTLKFHCNICS